MEQIINFIKRNVWILYLSVAALICVLHRLFLPTDMSFFTTMAMASVLLFDVYRIVFGKRRTKNSTIPYAIVVIIFVNQLYSYEVLAKLIPALSHIAPLWAAVVMICIVLVLMFLWKLIPILNARASDTTDDVIGSTTAEGSTAAPSAHIEFSAPPRTANRKKPSLRPLMIPFILLVILAFTHFAFRFVISQDTTEPFDLLSIVSHLASYGATVLAVLLAVGITVVIIIELIRFIYSRIWLPRISESKQNGSSLPLYVFSCIIVAVLFYLSYKISGFTIDDFVDIIYEGKYLALPLTVLVVIAAFFVLVHVTHGIILLLKSMNAQEIKKFFSRVDESTDLTNSVATIGKTIVSIVLNTIITALGFVKFIPDFVESIYRFSFAVEDDTDEEHDDISM